jgi:alpha-tubulin suppressor-like RCC1 family protein
MAHDVFISYSTKDKLVADGICVNLEAAGVRCWIAPRDIAPGEDWPTAITRAISQSRVMVLVFSASSNSSEDVSRELFLAANSKLVIIPFKIENIEPEPGKQYYLARTHWLDAINPPTQEQIRTLLNCVKVLLPVRETLPVFEVQPNIPQHIDQPIPGNEPPQLHLPRPTPKKRPAWLRYLWIPASFVLLGLIGWVILTFVRHTFPELTLVRAMATETATATIPIPATLTPTVVILHLSSPTSTIVQIYAGGWHTCSLTDDGGVKCWGYNYWGQLGNGTTTDSGTPVDVYGLTGNVITMAPGARHTCALTAGGGVKCWGDNEFGQLGNGTKTNNSIPVDVSGLASGVTAITAFNNHTCALTANGEVKCWGSNEYGQLGNGTNTDSSTPVDVRGLTGDVIAIAAGWHHTCALIASGGVQCWGSNDYGGLGDGTKTFSSIPVDVSGLTGDVIAIAVGGWHSCALAAGGGVKCWGNNFWGQLGDSTNTDISIPVDAIGLASAVTAIALGGEHTCAITASGGLQCWGSNGDGQLGNGTNTDSTTPVNVSGLVNGVTAIALGSFHTCAVTVSSGVKCWGDNEFAQLGDGTTINRSTPVDVIGLGKP